MFDIAADFALAKDTANNALAPRFFLFSLASKSNKILSIFDCSSGFNPFRLGEIFSFILETAKLTLFPKNLFLSKSLNSKASNDPVEAPEGDIAVALIPLSK